MDCIFCKIIDKEIPARIVYEDDKYLAFLDINPVNKGHTLVIPKDHVATYSELDNEQAADMAKKAHQLAPQIVQALGAKGFNLCLNNGSVAGQIIDHVHFHIIPRFGGDNLQLWPGKEEEIDLLDETFSKLKEIK